MAKGFASPKAVINVGDGFEYLKNHQNEFDVIITDSSDPEGENKMQRLGEVETCWRPFVI